MWSTAIRSKGKLNGKSVEKYKTCIEIYKPAGPVPANFASIN